MAAAAGYSFFEWNAGTFLRPRESEADFAAALAAARRAPIPCAAVNCFVPPDLKITGPTADLAALEAYVRVALRRAEAAGLQRIVFGSGGARQIPDGFDPARARAQIAAFCGMLAPIAGAHRVTVAVEPLHRGVCNVLNTVAECAALVREVNHPAVRLLVDSLHLMKDHDSLASVVANGDLLAHVHVSTVPNGLPPGAEACDFAPFFRALADARYHGRVSIEARLTTPETELPAALALMQQLERQAVM